MQAALSCLNCSKVFSVDRSIAVVVAECEQVTPALFIANDSLQRVKGSHKGPSLVHRRRRASPLSAQQSPQDRAPPAPREHAESVTSPAPRQTLLLHAPGLAGRFGVAPHVLDVLGIRSEAHRRGILESGSNSPAPRACERSRVRRLARPWARASDGSARGRCGLAFLPAGSGAGEGAAAPGGAGGLDAFVKSGAHAPGAPGAAPWYAEDLSAAEAPPDGAYAGGCDEAPLPGGWARARPLRDALRAQRAARQEAARGASRGQPDEAPLEAPLVVRIDPGVNTTECRTAQCPRGAALPPLAADRQTRTVAGVGDSVSVSVSVSVFGVTNAAGRAAGSTHAPRGLRRSAPGSSPGSPRRSTQALTAHDRGRVSWWGA
jgi:hypothetical protein